MPWISIIFYVITHIPDLVAIVKALMELVRGLPHGARGPQAMAINAMMTEAIKAHRETGEKLQIKNVCVGVGCATSLVAE